MKQDIIYMDEEAYRDFLSSMKDLEGKIKKARYEKGSGALEQKGDTWHDNFTFENAKNTEMMLTKRYFDLKNELSRIKIIKQTAEKDIVGVGSSFTLLFADDVEKKEVDLKLVSSTKNLDDNNVTLNSPMGKSIYGKKIGDIIEYKINNKIIKASIIKIF